MITIATLLWAPNPKSRSFSAMYTEAWVDRLYRGFARNLTQPFRFACFVDHPRTFAEPIDQHLIASRIPGYADCIQPYELGRPMILVGLDTVVTGNVDHLAASCFTRLDIGLPIDPYNPSQACNGVALVPEGFECVAEDHSGQNDMEHVRAYPHSYLDHEFPGHVVSYKGAVKDRGLGDARIVYFHGQEKPHELNLPWIAEHWR